MLRSIPEHVRQLYRINYGYLVRVRVRHRVRIRVPFRPITVRSAVPFRKLSYPEWGAVLPFRKLYQPGLEPFLFCGLTVLRKRYHLFAILSMSLTLTLILTIILARGQKIALGCSSSFEQYHGTAVYSSRYFLVPQYHKYCSFSAWY